MNGLMVSSRFVSNSFPKGGNTNCWWIEKDTRQIIFLFKKVWKEKFFNETILNHSKAIAFLLEEGEIMDYLQQSNTKESVRFFDDYEQALIWLNEYPI